jgi:hypothetical protein
MRRAHQITKDYAVNIEAFWADILDPKAQADSMNDLISYQGLPSEPIHHGQKATVKLKRWGWSPMGKWSKEVVSLNHETYTLESREHGGIVKEYRHCIAQCKSSRIYKAFGGREFGALFGFQLGTGSQSQHVK